MGVTKRFAYLTLAGLLSGGCVLPVNQSQLCEEFYDLPTLQDQYKQFRGYPIKAKLEIHFCGMERHPKRRGNASEIASEGSKNIPFLLDRLKAERLDTRRHDIIYIFEQLARQGHLAGRRDILDELEHEANNIKLKLYREQSQESLRTIRERVGQTPSGKL